MIDCLMIFKAVVVCTMGVFLYWSYSHRRTPFATCPLRPGDSQHDERIARSNEIFHIVVQSATVSHINHEEKGSRQTADGFNKGFSFSLSLTLSQSRRSRPVVFRNLRSYMRRTKANIPATPVVTASRVSH